MNSMKKTLVLGCNGMAGHVISIYLESEGYVVDKLARIKSIFKDTILMDVTDFISLKNLILANDYDIIINAVGVLNTDAEINHDKAVLINSYLPQMLASVTKNTKSKVIHISTDCVFSGNKGYYSETDVSDASTFYGKSKALGELKDEKNLTLRTSIVGPDINEKGIGLFNWFMKSRRCSTLSGYSKSMWGGVSTIELAKAIKLSIDDDLVGLYHLTNSKKISKYELLALFNTHFANDSICISQNDNYIADKSLISVHDIFDVPQYDIMIREIKDWIECNSNIYNWY